jgi:hypothetical protein
VSNEEGEGEVTTTTTRRRYRPITFIDPDIKEFIRMRAAQEGMPEGAVLRKIINEWQTLRETLTLEELIDKSAEYFNILMTRKKIDPDTGKIIDADIADLYKAWLMQSITFAHLSNLMAATASNVTSKVLEHHAKMLQMTRVEVSTPTPPTAEASIQPTLTEKEKRLLSIRERLADRIMDVLLERAEKIEVAGEKKRIDEVMGEVLEPLAIVAKTFMRRALGISPGALSTEKGAAIHIKEDRREPAGVTAQ